MSMDTQLLERSLGAWKKEEISVTIDHNANIFLEPLHPPKKIK